MNDVSGQLPTVTAGAEPRPTAGVDWAKDDHAVAVVDHHGREAARRTVTHTAEGLRGLVGFLHQHEVNEVGIERPDGQVVEVLLAAGLTVLVIPPRQIKSLRSRYGAVGNNDDRFDAYVLADTLRTDRSRLRASTPDTEATVALRSIVRARKELVVHRVATANQLRAHLQTFHPAPVGLFDEIDNEISLRFLTRFDRQDRLDWLTPTRLAGFLAKVRYSGHVDPAVLHARITAAPAGARGELGAATAEVTHALVGR